MYYYSYGPKGNKTTDRGELFSFDTGSSDPGEDEYDGYGAGNPPSWFNQYKAMGWNARYNGTSVNYARNNFDNDYYADEIADWEYGWYEANYHITGSRY